jgi:hypothetical protein
MRFLESGMTLGITAILALTLAAALVAFAGPAWLRRHVVRALLWSYAAFIAVTVVYTALFGMPACNNGMGGIPGCPVPTLLKH